MIAKALGFGGVSVAFASVVISAVTATVVAFSHTETIAPQTGGGKIPSTEPISDIPADRLVLYQRAATVCPGLDWTVLAAIGKVESDHGRSPLPGVAAGENFAGAGGSMQFLAPTFDAVVARHPMPPGGASPPSRYDASDAIHAAAFYLCDSGAPTDLYAAIFAYNHADWYVTQVLEQAARYQHHQPAAGGDCYDIQASNPYAYNAIAFACAQLGQPYVWGGDGPAEGGWDCSGLTKAAYATAGIGLPRTAAEQFYAGMPVLEDHLQPGDLVYYGTATDIHHVGIVLGAGLMINAPTFNQPVQIEPYRYLGDDYFGATRPTNLPA
ncbi:bifunctional lytic transglycosylase/C40 family peptidase [Nocardia sp. CS682]|uniref:C40 family peptidase n=1 Tax=Nocardia sp. CS682 TaxID=1047172 RepID=UPI001074A659|nr:bifunctional lytic transglycosylase/C40 family peptidase [Nocardia sp. CS682]QBS41340.1 hydrolase Nlp/P60 [Nocardia sp. CS682]